MLLEILLIVFPTYGITNESERFSEKILTSLVRRRNEHFREMQGSRMHSFGPGVNRRANSLKSILSAELTQQIILELLTGHGIFVGMGFCPESNCNPDILMRGRRTGDKFALEYKYCFRYYYSEKYHTQTICLARPDRIENYLRYQKEQNVLVYAVTGVGNYILWARKRSD